MTTAPALALSVDQRTTSAGYASRPVAVATRHDKAAVLQDVLGLTGLLLIPVEVDTDRLGTFSGEVPRVLDIAATATAKARLGAAVSGLALNLASEGGFAPDPATGLFVVQSEVVALVDTEDGLVVHGRASRYAPWVRSWRCRSEAEAVELVADLDLRRHRLLVRPVDPRPTDDPTAVTTGVSDLATLRRAVARAAASGSEVVVETDLRSHVCPMRHPVMRAAAADLLVRLASRCPACESAGFGPQHWLPGAPCRACGDATDEVAAVLHECPACGHGEERAVLGGGADPSVCPGCNP